MENRDDELSADRRSGRYRARARTRGKSALARSYCAALVSPITIAAGPYEPRGTRRRGVSASGPLCITCEPARSSNRENPRCLASLNIRSIRSPLSVSLSPSLLDTRWSRSPPLENRLGPPFDSASNACTYVCFGYIVARVG